MPSTSVHLPADLLEQLDRAARRRRVSRNRLIVEACRSLVGQGQPDWPEDFFVTDHLSEQDLTLLRSTFDDWSCRLSAARRSREGTPF
jgi:hypothetical protein